MKKVLAVLLSIVMCFALMANVFAATHDCETFEITVPDDFNGTADDLYIMSEYDDGIDDLYYYIFDFDEYYGWVSVEIYEYFGRFTYNDQIMAKSSDDYYFVLNQIADETGKEVVEFNGCPAVILDDWRNDFEIIVCTDSYLYWIELTHGDTIIPEIDEAYDAIQGMAFFDNVSYYDGYSAYGSSGSASASSDGSSSSSSSSSNGAGTSSGGGTNNVVINNNINTQTTAKPEAVKPTTEKTTAQKHEKAQTTDPTLVVSTIETTVANTQATEATTANADTNAESNSNTGLIVAIIVAAVIIGGALIALCVVMTKKKK